MKYLDSCPGCGSAQIKPYSCTPEKERGNAIHFSQSICRSCDLVFSNPVAEPQELERFYQGNYYEEAGRGNQLCGADLEAFVRKRIAEEVLGLQGVILPYATSGNFFEIGTGFGSLLEAARHHGFTVSGVEPSKRAASFAKVALGLKGVREGMFDPKEWPVAFYDVIYSFQVIEHVSDLRGFVGGMCQMLKPGGLAVIGTENHHNSWVAYRKVRAWLMGRCLPEFQTSDHHTFYFSNRSLCALLKREGFEIIRALVYSKSLEDKLKVSRFRNILTKAFFYLLHYTEVWSKRGNRLLIWCRKPLEGGIK